VANLREQVDMHKRKPRAEVHASSVSPGAGNSAPDKTRVDPLAATIAREFDLKAPGAGAGLRRLQIMKVNGEEITLDVARAVMRTFTEYHARLQREAEQKHQGAVVYYMRLGDMVKIGWTTDLATRRQDVNPQEVLATEPGDMKLERQRHQQFADLRVHGEWFRLEPPLTEWISEVKARSTIEA
jgi:hypothetical protein